MRARILRRSLLAVALSFTTLACEPSGASSTVDGYEPDASVGVASEAIVGGRELLAAEVEARGLVGLVAVLDAERTGYCSGTLVGDRWVLTAAHCMRTRRGAVRFAVFARDIFAEPRESIAIERIVRHPTADLALVRLSLAAPARYARIPMVPRATRFRRGEVELAGFGRRDPSVATSGGPGGALVAMATNVEPGATIFAVTARSAGACFGDSGGPAYVVRSTSRAVLGALSSGNPSCRGGDTYVPTTTYEAWLRSTAGTEVRFADPG